MEMSLPDDNRVHQSVLKEMAKSPAHYQWKKMHPRDDTPGFRMGRAVHAMWLQSVEPIVFSATKRGTKAWEEFIAPLGDAAEDVLIPTEHDTVRRMFDALQKDRDATELLARCPEREKKIEWDLMGLSCGGRLDACGTDILLDLKSCRAAYPRKFLWEAENLYHYDAQIPWYDVGRGAVIPCGPDTKWSEQYLVAVENVAPYNVQCYKLDPLRIDQGWTKIEGWMNRLKICLEMNEWPGYLDGIQVWDGAVTFDAPEDEEED
jgi:hypothetical protein